MNNILKNTLLLIFAGLLLTSCLPQKHENMGALPVLFSDIKGQDRVIPLPAKEWLFAKIPGTPFEMPLPTSYSTTGTSVFSVNYRQTAKADPNTLFDFAVYRQENWTGSLMDYKEKIYRDYDICKEITWSEHDGVGVINFIGTCGVTCEQEVLLYQGTAYLLKDGCDLTEKGRESKAAAIFNVRPVQP